MSMIAGGTSALRRPAGIGHWMYITSDYRKKVYANLNMSNFWGFENAVKGNDISLSLNFQPLDALRISLSSSYSYYWRRQDQFVSNIKFNNITRTIVGEVKQRTLRFTGRVNFNISPDLTIQYYGQPFITRPLYSNFAYVSDPLAKKYDDRFHAFGNGEISFVNGNCVVDENNDGTADYSFGKPDFNFVQFRSNLVIRWEYKPGSELYLVWSQGNTPDAFDDLDSPVFKSLFDNVFAEQARNIFLMKWTYRFLR